ncbi:hypothetical protein PHMEG_00014024 [Phytophthora megakarya]|uniref:Eukaryotic/viral aspartic protease n=1 Tax=Phytophthora megakarya TaxID=4795 RepID=A0A225W6H6_9STRA|nr:hypothetical protein PHMEG_00014024 [Phytophthora megakarya]
MGRRFDGPEGDLGIDFTTPAGIRLDLGDESLCLPDGVRIQLSGRRQPFSGNSKLTTFDQHGIVLVAEFVEIAIRSRCRISRHCGLPDEIYGSRRTWGSRTWQINRIGIWLTGNHVPRTTGLPSHHRRNTDIKLGRSSGRTVGRQTAVRPTDRKLEEGVETAKTDVSPTITQRGDEDHRHGGSSPKLEPTDPDHSAMEATKTDQGQFELGNRTGEPERDSGPAKVLVKPDRDADDNRDDLFCFYHEGGDIFHEDFENHKAVLPKVEAIQAR